MVGQAGSISVRVEVLSGSWRCLPFANEIGVLCEAESEGSGRQTFEPTNRNLIRDVLTRMMLQNKKKSHTAQIVKT